MAKAQKHRITAPAVEHMYCINMFGENKSDLQYREGEDFAAGFFRTRKIRVGYISHAVPNLLWEISHPHAVSLPLARLDLP